MVQHDNSLDSLFNHRQEEGEESQDQEFPWRNYWLRMDFVRNIRYRTEYHLSLRVAGEKEGGAAVGNTQNNGGVVGVGGCIYRQNRADGVAKAELVTGGGNRDGFSLLLHITGKVTEGTARVARMNGWLPPRKRSFVRCSVARSSKAGNNKCLRILQGNGKKRSRLKLTYFEKKLSKGLSQKSWLLRQPLFAFYRNVRTKSCGFRNAKPTFFL